MLDKSRRTGLKRPGAPDSPDHNRRLLAVAGSSGQTYRSEGIHATGRFGHRAGSRRGGQATSGRRRLAQGGRDATMGPARLTRDARNVLLLAADEARALKHTMVGTEHILLGLLREEHGLAARLLNSLEITLADVRGR
jgi:hypothetical protein